MPNILLNILAPSVQHHLSLCLKEENKRQIKEQWKRIHQLKHDKKTHSVLQLDGYEHKTSLRTQINFIWGIYTWLLIFILIFRENSTGLKGFPTQDHENEETPKKLRSTQLQDLL